MELPKGGRYGRHSLRRQPAAEMTETPLEDLAYVGGRKSAQTLLSCYQLPDVATQRRALPRRRQLRGPGEDGNFDTSIRHLRAPEQDASTA